MITAAILFVIYIISILFLFGVPDSLSQTHYLWKSRCKYGKVIFPGFLMTFCGILLPNIMSLTEGSNYQFLGFIMIVALLFVAFSPLFLEKGIRPVHFAGAIVSAICGVCFSLVFGNWIVVLSVAMIFSILSLMYRKKSMFLMEMAAFVSVIITLLTYVI